MAIEVYNLLARYNAHANNAMNAIISRLQPEQWEKEFDGYFKSIKSLCSHLYIADFNWLKRFGTLRAFRSLNDPIFEATFALGSSPFDTIAAYKDKRAALDRFISAFAEEITPDDAARNLQYRNFRNEDQNRNVGGLVIHFFNHQTHHRGMISQYLDMLGMDNDFSNLLVLV